MQGILEGIRVVEWGIFHAGPGCAAILGDMGAEVIKFELPGRGDSTRAIPRYKNINFNIEGGKNLFFECVNRGKKSITIDLGHEEGRRIAYKIIEASDVFLTNLRPETVKEKKMDYEHLAQVNPNLIYSLLTSHGSRGPDADRGGFDYQAQAKAGFMFSIGEPGDKPLLAQFALFDQTASIVESYQIMIALYMRERLGFGQELELSLLGTASYVMYLNNIYALLTGREIPRHEQATADPLRNYYKCKDGKWVIHTQPAREGTWQMVCDIMGLGHLARNPLYDNRDKRMDRSEELVKKFNVAFLTRPSYEWIQLFSEKDLVISEINTSTEAVNSPQMLENDYIIDFNHPDLGEIRIPGFPIQFSKTKINHNFIAPRLGEHTDGILKEICGLSDKEIAGLRDRKII